MRTQPAIAILTVLALVLSLGACAASPSSPTSARSVGEASPATAPREPLTGDRAFVAAKFGDVELVDQHGRRRAVFDELVRDKVVVIQFLYTRCTGSCPGTTAKLVQVRDLLGERFGRDVTFLGFSLDPEHDAPKDFAEYAKAYGIEGGWTFLTGTHDELEALRKRLGFYDLDPVIDADRAQHAAYLFMGNEAKGRWMHMPANVKPEAIVSGIDRLML